MGDLGLSSLARLPTLQLVGLICAFIQPTAVRAAQEHTASHFTGETANAQCYYMTSHMRKQHDDS